MRTEGNPDILASHSLTRVLDYVRRHLAEPISLDTLAALAGLSTCRFSVVFRRQVGVPPHRYISQRRIARARELLRHGVSAAQVADACGFYDQSHFSRHFKQQCGMTPGQYAARARARPHARMRGADRREHAGAAPPCASDATA